MAPDVIQWTVFAGIVLVAVWVGGLFLFVQWVLNNYLVHAAVFVAAVVLLVTVHETVGHRRHD